MRIFIGAGTGERVLVVGLAAGDDVVSSKIFGGERRVWLVEDSELGDSMGALFCFPMAMGCGSGRLVRFFRESRGCRTVETFHM